MSSTTERNLPNITPTELGASKRAVYDFAEKTANHFGYQKGGDLISLIEKLGGKVMSVTMDAWGHLSGSIFVFGPRDFEIFIPSYGSPLRNRFTLAHELGHYVLHSQMGLIRIKADRYKTNGRDRVEWEANWFASGFLMPEKAIREAVSKYGSDPYAICSEFGVSVEAAEIRLESIG